MTWRQLELPGVAPIPLPGTVEVPIWSALAQHAAADLLLAAIADEFYAPHPWIKVDHWHRCSACDAPARCWSALKWMRHTLLCAACCIAAGVGRELPPIYEVRE